MHQVLALMLIASGTPFLLLNAVQLFRAKKLLSIFHLSGLKGLLNVW
jgi:hypothetical protein